MTLQRTQDVPSRTDRIATRRRFLMCPPEHFGVEYAINPWMDPSVEVDRSLAMSQWETLRRTYEELGHVVDVLAPEPGLPDMVFAANGSLVVGGTAVSARFRYPERQGESAAHLAWLRGAVADGELTEVHESVHTNECEGDFAMVGDVLLAGHGFRTDVAAHREAQELLGVPVISLELVDPLYYHLDTVLAALDDTNVVCFPDAFSPGSRAVLRRLFPDAVVATGHDAAVLGLNVVSDGANVVMPVQARDLARQLRERGWTPVEVDLSELLKAGGGVKCCTMEIWR